MRGSGIRTISRFDLEVCVGMDVAECIRIRSCLS